MRNQEVRDLAERFWRYVDTREPFPRDLEGPVCWSLPVALVKLPHLTVERVSGWLEEHEVPHIFSVTDRDLRACLVAARGKGILFLDGTDRDDEKRLSLAHEVSHFLLDYYWPRLKTLRVMGDSIRDVLDGFRKPNIQERLSAVLSDVRLGVYTYLMDRSPAGEIKPFHILDSEDRADRLALELLAPMSDVIGHGTLDKADWTADSTKTLVARVLTNEFGLPESAANPYADMITGANRKPQSFREWISVEP